MVIKHDICIYNTVSSDIYEPDSIASEDTELVVDDIDDDDDGMELEMLNN